MPVYRPYPHPQQPPKIAAVLPQGVIVSAEARILTYSPLNGSSSAQKAGSVRIDSRSMQSGQSAVARPAQAQWSSQSLMKGSDATQRATNARLSQSSGTKGSSSVARSGESRINFSSTLSGFSSVLAVIAAEARLFFRSLFQGNAEVGATSSPVFDASNLNIEIDLEGKRTIHSKWMVAINTNWISNKTIRVLNLEMTKTGVRIDPVVIGDDFQVTRIYSGLPTGISIDMAWFTVRETELSVAALISKVITPTEGSSGHIVVAATTNGYVEMFFSPTKEETILATVSEYVYDIQIRTTLGKIYTMEKGTIPFILGVTHVTS